MKLSFLKTIQGHEVEFVRLLYPLRYDVYLRHMDRTPIKITFNKDETGTWNPNPAENIPGWVNEISLPIIMMIEDNEAETETD